MKSRTVGEHTHPFGLKRCHVRATHARITEINNVPCSEPCVVEQQVNVEEVGVAPEAEACQAREPGQSADVADRAKIEADERQARETAQCAERESSSCVLQHGLTAGRQARVPF